MSKERSITFRLAGEGVPAVFRKMWKYSRKRAREIERQGQSPIIDDETQSWAGIFALHQLDSAANRDVAMRGEEAGSGKVKTLAVGEYENEMRDALVGGVVAFATFAKKRGVTEVVDIEENDDGCIVYVVEENGKNGAFCVGKGKQAMERLASTAEAEMPSGEVQ